MRVIVRFGFDIEELPDDDSYQHWIRSACEQLAKEESELKPKEDPWKDHNLKYKVVHNGETLVTYDGTTTPAFERIYKEQINR
jgi:hypothetical protein